MPLGLGVTRIVLIVALILATAYFFAVSNPRAYYETLSERFIFGVPWGTLVSVFGVVSFYLFVQGGLQHWNDPVTLPFRSWSYSYPEGILAAGFAHANPNHLIGNMVGTVVLAPIVEYAWGHYPPTKTDQSTDYTYPPPGDVQPEQQTLQPSASGLLNRPWIRALVIFPLAVIVVSIVTSVLALGWSLGFSGTVFAFGGFAVIYFPVAAIFGMLGITGSTVIVTTLREPVLRATAEPGTPGPPGWWGVNVQAHMLGFLLGVLLALVLLRHRDEKRTPLLVFLAVLTFGLTRQLWAFATSGGDGVFIQQRGVGLLFLLALTILITAAVNASDERIPPLFEGVGVIPSRVTLAYLWLLLVGVFAILLWVWLGSTGFGWVGTLLFVLALVIVILPGIPVVVPDRIVATPISSRQLVLFGLVVIVLIVSLPSFVSNAPGMGADPVPGNDSVAVEDYHVTYAEDVPHARTSGNESGVIVVSETRDIWISVVDSKELANSGEETVVVGGFSWRETVTVNRTGWDLTGGDSVYVVDVEDDTRVFESGQETAGPEIENQTITIVPGDELFSIQVIEDHQIVGEEPMPARNETVTVGDLTFSREPDDDGETLFASKDGTRVQIATKES